MAHRALVFDAIADIGTIGPIAEAPFDPIIATGLLNQIELHRLTNCRGTRFPFPRCQGIELFEVFVGNIGEDASHSDIMI